MLSPPAPEAKRRKLRKGTFSCRECKRRKMKCVFSPLNDTICNSCRHRGSDCISQEFPEDVWISEARIGRGPNSHTSNDTVGRTPLTSSGEGRRSNDAPILVPTILDASTSLGFYQSHERYSAEDHVPSNNLGEAATDISTTDGKHERLSRFLHKSLPPWEDMERICKGSGRSSVLAHEFLTNSYTTLEKTGLRTAESLLHIPEPNAHPVLIARHMLQLAILLQHLHPSLHIETKSLSEVPRTTMERLANLAIDLVTTKDELLGSIEGLECVMIECMYQAHSGSLRRSWVANRRAMGIAQLMGLDRSDHRTQLQVLDPDNMRCDLQSMWLRTVFLDRQLCLLLGLPQGCPDRSMASDALLATDTPMGRLERIHCVLSSKLLERNDSDPSSRDYATTRTLDVELQKAARSLPGKWWLTPNFATVPTSPQSLFWDTRRLFAQVLHFNLLNQLHLPYMLHSSSPSKQRYEYSRMTCVNASREVLSRFITLRSFNRIAYSCPVDFLALMAAMTLLLAHLDSRHYIETEENMLAHQYFSDRAMIEQTQENMREVNRVSSDALSSQGAELLGKLLAVEGEMTDGVARVRVQGRDSGTAVAEREDETAVTVNIPYFGIVRISSEGMSKESPKQPSSVSNRLSHLQPANTLVRIQDTETAHTEHHVRHFGLARPSRMLIPELVGPMDAGFVHLETSSVSPNSHAVTRLSGIATTDIAPQLQSAFSNPFLQEGGYPSLTAPSEDWAFQGVDMAFFGNLMGAARDDGIDDARWDI